jgi:NADPH:quinone reductase-like Zn-dependent oxidoreductase
MKSMFVAISCLTILAVLSSHVAGADEKLMMKAVVAHEYGAPEVLKLEGGPRPEPKENEALVRVIASGVNPADPLTLSGKYAKEFGTHLPLIPGYEIAGVVEKTGANVTKLKVGDAVYGYPTFGGGWAEYVTVQEWEVAAKPASLNFVEAAAVPMGALTAWQALVDVAKLQAGQTILIHGGSGGVGSSSNSALMRQWIIQRPGLKILRKMWTPCSIPWAKKRWHVLTA